MQSDIYERSKTPFSGVLLLFGAVILTGILIGGLASLVSRFIYLIIMFPAIMGAVAGFFVKSIVVSRKIRSKLVVVSAGILAALVIYGSLHFFDYLQFRSEVAKAIQEQVVADYGETAPDQEVQAYIDYMLGEETGSSGFPGFVLLEAREGVSISHVGVGASSSDLNLGRFTWLYWLFEMGIIGVIAAKEAYTTTDELFCEHCDTWVAPTEHIGGVALDALRQTAELINCRDFAGFVDMLQPGTTPPSVEFYTRTCKTCNAFPFYLTGVALVPGDKGQVQSQVLLGQVLNPSERFALTTALKARGITN